MLFCSRISHFLGLLTYLYSAAFNIAGRKGTWERMVQPQPPVSHLWTLFFRGCGAGQNSWQFPILKANNFFKLCHHVCHVTFRILSFIFSLFFALCIGFAKGNTFFCPIHGRFFSLCPFSLSITKGNASSPFHVINKSKKKEKKACFVTSCCANIFFRTTVFYPLKEEYNFLLQCNLQAAVGWCNK